MAKRMNHNPGQNESSKKYSFTISGAVLKDGIPVILPALGKASLV
jgi:hypothetical protein